MIYMDVDVIVWAKKLNLEIKKNYCPWNCGEITNRKAVQTKYSKGIIYECNCGAFIYQGRPKDREFWEDII